MFMSLPRSSWPPSKGSVPIQLSMHQGYICKKQNTSSSNVERCSSSETEDREVDSVTEEHLLAVGWGEEEGSLLQALRLGTAENEDRVSTRAAWFGLRRRPTIGRVLAGQVANNERQVAKNGCATDKISERKGRKQDLYTLKPLLYPSRFGTHI